MKTKCQSVLAAILYKNKIKQKELAELTGITEADISCIIHGRKFVFPGWKRRISDALDMPEDVIFPEEGL